MRDKIGLILLTLGALLIGVGATVAVVTTGTPVAGGLLIGGGIFLFLMGVVVVMWPHRVRQAPPTPAVVTPARAAPAPSAMSTSPVPARAITPASAPKPRVKFEGTPEDLTGMFKGVTAIQGRKLVEQQFGKWMAVSGPIGNVLSSQEDRAFVTFQDRSLFNNNVVYALFRGKEWVDRLSLLHQGDPIALTGRIETVDSQGITLQDCEFV